MATRPIISGVTTLVGKVMRSRLPGTSEHALRTANNFVDKAPRDTFQQLGKDVKTLAEQITKAETGQKSLLDNYAGHIYKIGKEEGFGKAVAAVWEDTVILVKSVIRYLSESFSTKNPAQAASGGG